MAYWGDYHTHTTYSHGKGSVMDNAVAAARVGLKQIAITDHGLRHMALNLKRREIPSLRRDCEEATAKTGVLVLCGVENNVHSFDGTLDATRDELELFDIVQGGYHKMVYARTFGQQFSYQLRNFIHSYLKSSPKKLIVKNTDSYLKVIEDYELDFVGHLNRDIRTDALTVARFAKQKGTYIELNSKNCSLTDAEIEKMAEEGVMFVVNSDAHHPDRVGDTSSIDALIERLHIPYSLIANWERFPDFRSHNYKRAVQAHAKASGGAAFANSEPDKPCGVSDDD